MRRTVVALVTLGTRTRLASALSSSSIHNIASIVPDDLVVKRVILIHRHGDRSQISRSAGPLHPESESVTEVWNERMPLPSTTALLGKVASKKLVLSEQGSSMAEDPTALYTGRDSEDRPYGQLTELGAQQMISVGRHLRLRFNNILFSENQPLIAEQLYCRSTNLCRTLMSLRCVLVGLLNINEKSDLKGKEVLIHARDKNLETMYPDCNDEPCKSMHIQRKNLYSGKYIANNFPGYAELEATFQRELGYDRVKWLTAREVLVCHAIHGIDLPRGISLADIDRVGELSGFMWERLFKNFELNRLSIGRFIAEIMTDLHASLAPQSKVKFLIYSGHDSTLVPVLCALGLYDGKWPEYASYLTLEVASSPNLPNEVFIRAVYNGNPLRMFAHTHDWCPMHLFEHEMRKFALDKTQYQQCCEECGEGSIAEAELREMTDEIKATLSKF